MPFMKKWLVIFLMPALFASTNEINLSVSFLYWQAQEQGLVYTFEQDNPGVSLPPLGNPATATTINNGRFKEIPATWTPAFSLALGYLFVDSTWEINAKWTRLETSSSSSSSGPNLTAFLLPVDFGDGSFHVFDATGTWKLHYNTLDFFFIHPTCVDSSFFLRPFFGLKAAIIDQRLEGDYRGNSLTGPGQYKGKNDFRSIGSGTGVDLMWRLNSHWSFLGKMGMALLYGKFDLSQQALAFVSLELAKQNLPQSFRALSSTELPGCEISFLTKDVNRSLEAALKAGAELITAPEPKPWGQTIAYVRDFNGILIEIGSEMMAGCASDSCCCH